MTESLIKAENVGMRYRQGLWKGSYHEALRSVSIEICEGQTLGIIGTNGCGKTSLLRILSGVMKPTTGNISIRPNLRIAMLSLGLGFRRDLSGRDNAFLSQVLQGVSNARARSRLDKIKDFSELGDFFERPLRTYSTGMQSRLGFATAMAIDIEVLLIDETLSVGDMQFKIKAAAALSEKMAQGLATVLVSHNAGQVEEICKDAVWLDKGKVRMAGPSSNVGLEYRKQMWKVG